MQLIRVGVLATSVLLIAASKVDAAAIATLALQSQPGDFIGQGGNFDISYPVHGEPINVGLLDTVQRFLPSELVFFLGDALQVPNSEADLYFGTNKLGIPIQPGTYTDAERALVAAPGHPGLDIVFQNRGCNMVAGSFTVTDATLLPNDTISSFSASFEQHCDGEVPALFGTFTYNANATEVPEPAAWSLAGIGTLCLLFRRRLPSATVTAK